LRQSKEAAYRAIMLRAIALEMEGKLEEAIKEREKAIELFKDEIEELEREATSSPESKARLTLINNRIVNVYRAKARLSIEAGKAEDAVLATRMANRWIAVHPQQTVIPDAGDPWDAWNRSLELMLENNPQDASVRVKYAEERSGELVDAALARKKAEDELAEARGALDTLAQDEAEARRDAAMATQALESVKEALNANDIERGVLRRERDDILKKTAISPADTARLKVIEGRLEELADERQGMESSIKEKEADLARARERLDKLLSGISAARGKIAELAKTASEKRKEESRIKKSTGPDDSSQQVSLDMAVDAYIFACASSKKEDIDAAAKRLQEMVRVYGADTMRSIIDKIDEKISLLPYVVTGRKARRLAEGELKNLKLRLAEEAYGLDAMVEKLETAAGEEVVLGGIVFSTVELFAYVSRKLTEGSKFADRARLALSVAMNPKLGGLTRIMALEDAVDLFYDKLGLSGLEELPRFEDMLRQVMKDIFASPLAGEPDIKSAFVRMYGRAQRSDAEWTLDRLSTLWTALSDLHKEKKEKQWSAMSAEEKRIFLVNAVSIPEPDKSNAEAAIRSLAFSQDDSAQLAQEADVIMAPNEIDEADPLEVRVEKTRLLLIALEKLKEASAIAPDDSGVHLKLARVHMMLKHYDQALSEAKTAVEKDEFNFEAHDIIIDLHRMLYNPLDLYSAYLALADARRKKAEAEKEKKDDTGFNENVAKAEESLDAADGLMPGRAEAIFARSRLLQISGDEDTALARLDSLFERQDLSWIRRLIPFRQKAKVPVGIDTVAKDARLARAKLLLSSSDSTKRAEALYDLLKAEEAGDKSAETYRGIADGYRDRVELAQKRAAKALLFMASPFLLGCASPLQGIINSVGLAYSQVFAVAPYLGLMAGAVIAAYLLYRYLVVTPRKERRLADEYYKKAVEAAGADALYYEAAMKGARDSGKADKAIEYAESAFSAVKPSEISDLAKRAEAEAALSRIRGMYAELMKRRISRMERGAGWRPWRTAARRIAVLQNALKSVITAQENIDAMEDGIQKAELSVYYLTLSIDTNERIVKLRRWDALRIRTAKRQVAQMELARSLIELAKVIPDNRSTEKAILLEEASDIMERLRLSSNVENIAPELSSLYVLYADNAVFNPAKRIALYDAAIALNPSNGRAYLGRGIVYLDYFVGHDEDGKGDIESALGLGLSDDEAIDAHERLAGFYSGLNPAMEQKHRKELDALKAKKKEKFERYYVSKKDEKEAARKTSAINSASEAIDLLQKLERQARAAERYIRRNSGVPGKGAMVERMKRRLADLHKDISNAMSKISSSLDDIPSGELRDLLNAQIKDPAGRARILGTMRWIVSRKPELIGRDMPAFKLMIVSLAVPTKGGQDLTKAQYLEVLALMKSIDPGRLTPPQRMSYSLLRARLAGFSDRKEDIEKGFDALYEAASMRYDNRFDKEATEIFTLLMGRLEKIEALGPDMPDSAQRLIDDRNFRKMAYYSSASLANVLSSLMSSRLDINNPAFIAEAMFSPLLSREDKEKYAKAFMEQARSTFTAKSFTGRTWPGLKRFIVAAKIIGEDKSLKAYSYMMLGYAYGLQGNPVLSRWSLWRAQRLDPSLRGERFFRLGESAFAKGTLSGAEEAIGYFSRAARYGYESPELYRHMALAEQTLAGALSAMSEPARISQLFRSSLGHMTKAKELDPKLQDDDIFRSELKDLYIKMLQRSGARLDTRNRTEFLNTRIGDLEDLYRLDANAMADNGVLESINFAFGIYDKLRPKDRRSNLALAAKMEALRGMHYLAARDFPEAKKAFDRALWIDGKCALANFGLKDYALRFSGDAGEALRRYYMAVQADPGLNSVNPQEIAGLLKDRADTMTRPEDKIPDLKEAAALDPTFRRRMDLAEAYFAIGSFDEAKRALDGILADEKIDETSKDDSRGLLKKMKAITKTIEGSVMRLANAEEAYDRLVREERRISGEIFDLSLERRAPGLAPERVQAIDNNIRMLEDSRESMLASPERATLDMPYMAAERAKEAEGQKDPARKREAERAARLKQVSGLIEVMKTRLLGESAVASRASLDFAPDEGSAAAM
nr:hypothetical protein [Candidatus Omnitrophota bacterium]